MGNGKRRPAPHLAAAAGILLLALLGPAPEAADLRPFGSGSYDQILDSHRGQAFVLVFWSVDCAPCHRELAMLGVLAARRPAMELVLVATDGQSAAREVEQTLAEHGLGAADAWIFDGPAERLRHTVDPTWYGTVPRTYLFDTGHQQRLIRGTATRATLTRWLRQQSPEPAPRRPGGARPEARERG